MGGPVDDEPGGIRAGGPHESGTRAVLTSPGGRGSVSRPPWVTGATFLAAGAGHPCPGCGPFGPVVVGGHHRDGFPPAASR